MYYVRYAKSLVRYRTPRESEIDYSSLSSTHLLFIRSYISFNVFSLSPLLLFIDDVYNLVKVNTVQDFRNENNTTRIQNFE